MRHIALLFCVFLLFSCERSGDIIDNPYSYRDDTPAWSNNGERIAFFSTGIKQTSDQTRGLYIINADGSNQMLIEELDILSFICNPVWLQADSEIVYSYNGIYKININSKEKQQLIADASSFDISPDGRHLYYTYSSDSSTCNYLILYKDLQTGKTDTITCGAHPSISSDLQYMALNKDGYIHYYNFIDSSVTPLNLEGSFPDWSPTGDLLVYELGDGIYGRSNIYVTELSDQRYKVVESGRRPNISPDGRKIIYVDYLNNLWIINLDGSDNTQLTF